MPAITLLGHLSTGHGGFPPRPSVEGCPRVTVGGVPVHCTGHAWAEHSSGGGTHAGYLAQGAQYVTIGGRGVGRVGDPITCGDTVAQGCKNVTVGNCGGEDFARDMIFDSLTDPKDKLLLCLEEIALAEAGRKTAAEDARGWKYLAAMFDKWFAGKANDNAASNPEPFWVDWDWIQEFLRARNAYHMFTSEGASTEPSNIYNAPSRAQLASYLARDELLGDSEVPFDYTALPWNQWYGRAFNYYPVRRGNWDDGLQAAMATFSFRALAAGYVKPVPGGGHRIIVTTCAVFAYDRFNFEGEDFLRYWNCEQKKFYVGLPWDRPVEDEVHNSDFVRFRSRYGIGNDFEVFSQAHPVAGFRGMNYVYP